MYKHAPLSKIHATSKILFEWFVSEKAQGFDTCGSECIFWQVCWTSPTKQTLWKKVKKKHDFYLWKLHLWRNWLPISKVKTFVKFFSKCFSCDLTSMSQKENLIHPFEKWYFRVYIFQKITLLDMCNIFRSKLHTAGGLCDKSQIVSFLKTYQLPYLLAKSWGFCLHIFSEV